MASIDDLTCYICGYHNCVCDVAPVTEMRDTPIPEHACVEHLDADSYCVLCGEKFSLRGAIDEIMGLAIQDEERLRKEYGS